MPNYNSEDLKSHDGVAAIIENERGEILLQDHVKFNFWTIPVGKCQPGGSVEEALRVEMREELGIEVVDFEEIGNFEKEYIRDGIPVTVNSHIIVINKYTGTITNNEPDKHRSLKWASIDEIKKLPSDKVSHSTKYYLELMDS